jgi:hypothetical protein
MTGTYYDLVYPLYGGSESVELVQESTTVYEQFPGNDCEWLPFVYAIMMPIVGNIWNLPK